MSPAVVPRGFRPSAWIRVEEELKSGERLGIGSILEFSTQKSERRESLRRTFSADMSSKKWSAENLHLSLKKNASTEELSTITASATSPASASGIQEEKEEIQKKELERPGQFDIWASILSQKNTNSDSPPITPYIHPLVKRSKSLLSQKSLENCTESLGSESGSDGYSSSSSDYFTSDSSDNEEEEEEEEDAVEDEMQNTKKELVAVNYNCSISRRSPPRSFPPPLPSLSRSAGPSLQMRPHRKDGRLIVEAVPVMSHTYLHAQREGGRLRLSFINSPCEKEASPLPQPEESEADFIEEEEEVEEQEEEEEAAVQKGEIVKAEMRDFEQEDERMKVGQPILVMNKIMGVMQHAMHLKNRNPFVGQKLDGQDHEQGRLSSPILAAVSFNGYDLYWKGRPMAHPSGKQGRPNKLMVSRKPLVFEAEDFLSVNRCNEYRRPVVVCEPFCIATT